MGGVKRKEIPLHDLREMTAKDLMAKYKVGPDAIRIRRREAGLQPGDYPMGRRYPNGELPEDVVSEMVRMWNEDFASVLAIATRFKIGRDRAADTLKKALGLNNLPKRITTKRGEAERLLRNIAKGKGGHCDSKGGRFGHTSYGEMSAALIEVHDWLQRQNKPVSIRDIGIRMGATGFTSADYMRQLVQLGLAEEVTSTKEVARDVMVFGVSQHTTITVVTGERRWVATRRMAVGEE